MSTGPNGNTVNLIIGQREVGKTPFFMGEEKYNIEGLIKPALKNNMKVLCVDMMYHPSYAHIKEIKKEQIELWKQGIYKIVAIEKKELREVFKFIRINLWNALLCFEDTFRYERIKLSEEMIAIIGNSKQQNVNIIFMYHHWKFVPLDLYIYLDYIEVFKTSSLPTQREADLLGDHFKKVVATCKRVNAHENFYYHESVYVKQ